MPPAPICRTRSRSTRLVLTTAIAVVTIAGCSPSPERSASSSTTAQADSSAPSIPPATTPAPAAGAATTAQETSPAPGTPAPPAPPAPVITATVSYLAQPIVVDGDPQKWSSVAALPAPYAKKTAGSLKLAWHEEGLYGCAQIEDAKITVDEQTPWQADALELWFEPDDARASDMGATDTQLVLTPRPATGAGECLVSVPQGPINAKSVIAKWKPTANGYALEFFIPAAELKPATFVATTKVGFNYAVDVAGKPVEEFFCDKNTDRGYATPASWGVIALGH